MGCHLLAHYNVMGVEIHNVASVCYRLLEVKGVLVYSCAIHVCCCVCVLWEGLFKLQRLLSRRAVAVASS